MTQITIQYCLDLATRQLTAVADQPSLEAEILLAFSLQQSRSYLRAYPESQLSNEQIQTFYEYVMRRFNAEPMAYILGKKEFWSLEFEVSPDTLIPRPETELLVELALKLVDQAQAKIADLGTGSGAIALSLAHERPAWQIYATDISQEALEIARKNAQRFRLNQVSFYSGNWCTALPCEDFDLIVSNPPYIAETEWTHYAAQLSYEPRHALVSGEKGLLAIQEISQSAKCYLKQGGFLLIEHGFLQGRETRNIFANEGYGQIETVCDLAGHERVTIARLTI